MLLCTSKEESLNCSHCTRHRNEGKGRIFLERVHASVTVLHDPDPSVTCAEIAQGGGGDTHPGCV